MLFTLSSIAGEDRIYLAQSINRVVTGNCCKWSYPLKHSDHLSSLPQRIGNISVLSQKSLVDLEHAIIVGAEFVILALYMAGEVSINKEEYLILYLISSRGITHG